MASEKRYRILVIENDVALLELLRDFLILSGFYVRTALDGLSGLELFKQETFDIIITDCEMPGMSGIELTALLRTMNPSLYIIGISADRKREAFLKAGADLFISKPFKLSQILEEIVKRCSG